MAALLGWGLFESLPESHQPHESAADVDLGFAEGCTNCWMMMAMMAMRVDLEAAKSLGWKDLRSAAALRGTGHGIYITSLIIAQYCRPRGDAAHITREVVGRPVMAGILARE